MGWYRLNLGAADFADAAKERIASQVRSDWEAAGHPHELAAYTRHESEGRLHCELIVYFSPAAANTARRLGATPCAAPGPWDLAHLAGGVTHQGSSDTP